MNKAKTNGEGGPINGIKDLRKEYTAISNEIKSLKLEDVAQVFMVFLNMFESQAFPEGNGSGNMMNVMHGSHHQDDIDSAHHRNAMFRRTETDVSSDDEPLSFSPSVGESSGQHLSDIARRRHVSDLLTKWMKTAEARGENPSMGVDDSSGQVDDQRQSVDVHELQRLIHEHHSGGQEESHLAEELLRLMNHSDDGNSSSTYAGSGAGMSQNALPPSNNSSPQIPPGTPNGGGCFMLHSNSQT